MAEVNEMLSSSLRTAIERIENTLKSGAKLADEFLLKGELLNKQSQLDEAAQQERYVEQEKKDKSRESAAISYLVEKETRLNEQEKEQYAHFLSKEYFTKSDFNELDHFYEHSWDKLSEEGKSQMTHRVAEGIKRGEFEFDDMPASMKKREADRLQEYGIKTNHQPDQQNQEIDRDYPHGDKSAPVGADLSKKIDPDKKNSDQEIKKESAGDFGNLAANFDDEVSSVKPTELKTTGNSLLR